MKRLFICGATVVLVAGASVFAQGTTTTSSGDDNASITASRTAGAQQQPRPTPSPVSPVRPLSQEDIRRSQEASERRRQSAQTGDPDVLLDVPNLSVEEITLKVKNLRARVSLDARLANLLALTAGADVGIDEVDLLRVDHAADTGRAGTYSERRQLHAHDGYAHRGGSDLVLRDRAGRVAVVDTRNGYRVSAIRTPR